MASAKNMKKFLQVYGVPLVEVLSKECRLSTEDCIKHVAQGIKKVLEKMVDDNKEHKEHKDYENVKSKKITKSRKKSKPEIVCEYIYVRSPKKGERCCSLVDKKSIKYCSKHIKKETDKQESKEDKKDKKKCVEKIKSEKTKKLNAMSDKLQSFINNNIPLIKIERNKEGYYILQNSRIVINPTTLEAYAYLNEENIAVELRKADLDICKELNLKFQIPCNLSDSLENKKTNVEEVEDYSGDTEEECYSEVESDLELDD